MNTPNQVCEECGCQVAPGSDICPKCRSNRCRCEHFNYKQMSVAVPWCLEQDQRIVIKGGLLCDECKEG